MANRNLRIDAVAAAGGVQKASTLTPPCYEASLLWHMRRNGLRKILLSQLCPSLFVLGLLYFAHAMLASERGSYAFTILLSLGLTLAGAASWPDKLAAPTLALAAMSGMLLAGFHLSFLSGRCFLVLTGVCGVIAALSLAILSVYAGACISKSAQELCFLLGLATAPLGALLHLFTAPGEDETQGEQAVLSTAGVSDTTSHASLSDLSAAPASSALLRSPPSLYLLGLLLSASFSLFTLCFNKRQAEVGGNMPIGGGGFIPGRDDDAALVSKGAAGRRVETPQVVSPSVQYRQRFAARKL